MGVTQTIVFFLILLAGVHTQNPYKICAKSKDISDCEQLNRKDIVKCFYNLHRIDCLLDIDQNKIDFGRVTPEEALVAAKFLKNVVVLGEFRHEQNINDDSELATVVIVRKNHTGGLRSFSGKKYCHPGFRFNQISTDYILKEFENAVLKESNAVGCQNGGILLEKELKALADHFGPSCRPGPWIGFEEYDIDFYKKYSKLCELCSNKEKCAAGTEPFKDSLQCLVDGGDVSITTINTVHEYFNKTENSNKKYEYGYLCQDGSVKDIENPCTWSKQPWNLIVANKEKANIKNDLQSWFTSNIINYDSNIKPFEDKTYIDIVKPILFPEERDYSKIKIVDGTPSLQEYLERYRQIPSVNEKCNESIKWCTVSTEEQEKCKWLAQASANFAVQPTISCVQSSSMFDCLQDIKTDKADVVASDAHYGYIARKKNFAPLAFPDTTATRRIKPIIVIRSDNSEIKKLNDLKNKKACFPEYGGIEWLSFITTARSQGVISKSSCDYGQLISDFLSDSCMPGAHDERHEVTGNIMKDKLCKLCQPDPYNSPTATNCNADQGNKFNGNTGALQCLKEVGDFAVVTKEQFTSFDSSLFKVMCKNGSLAHYTGFDVDDDCTLTQIIDSEVISKKVSSKLGDIRLLLLNLETRFGLDRHKPFEVFNIFNNTYDLLFKDATLGLSPVNTDKPHIKNFVNLFADTERCVEEGKSENSATSLKLSVLPLLIGFVFLNTLQRIYL